MITSFTVDRATWLHGEGSLASVLLRVDGKKCCIGFLCLAAGVPKQEIYNAGTVAALEHAEHRALVPTALQTEPGRVLMTINDNPVLADHVREQKLIEGFKDIGIELTFTGWY